MSNANPKIIELSLCHDEEPEQPVQAEEINKGNALEQNPAPASDNRADQSGRQPSAKAAEMASNRYHDTIRVEARWTGEPQQVIREI